ncbi:metallophosphoesterase family protein [Xylanimonas ulmi]|nr:metallophosphoesterase [Xylanibacterium ulmi]
MNHRDTVVVAGDWHGNTLWAMRAVAATAKAGCDVLLHLGDFGIWPGPSGASYLRKVERACAQHGVTILVTPGNHENWDRIDRTEATDRHDGWGAVKWLTDHIAVLPRGHRLTLAGTGGVERTLVSLGGAPSIDLRDRTLGKTWWLQEAITPVDVESVIAGGTADIMLTHDTPEPATRRVQQIIRANPGGWPADVREYCAEGRRRLTRAFNAVRPRVLLHGHYHLRDTDTVIGDTDGDPFTCRIESLGMDGTPHRAFDGHPTDHQEGDAVLLDVATAAVTDLLL